MFCYVNNSPVKLYDPFGDEPIDLFKKILAFTASFAVAYVFQIGTWSSPKLPTLVYNNVIDSSYTVKTFRISSKVAKALELVAKIGAIALEAAIFKYLSVFIKSIEKVFAKIVLNTTLAEVLVGEVIEALTSFSLFESVFEGTYHFYVGVFIEENPENTAQLEYSYCIILRGPRRTSLKIRIFGDSL